MASRYLYKGTSITDFLSPIPTGFDSSISSYTTLWAEESKYKDIETGKFTLANCFSSSFSEWFFGKNLPEDLVSSFKGSNLNILAAKGSCPIPYRTYTSDSKELYAGIFRNYVFTYSSEPLPYGFIETSSEGTSYIRYINDEGIKVSSDNNEWVLIPNTCNSSTVVIDLVGAGGGGSGSLYTSDYNLFQMFGGAGGGGGGYASALLDLTTSDYFTIELGSRGSAGSGGRPEVVAPTDGESGGDAKVWNSNTDIISAYGGYGGIAPYLTDKGQLHKGTGGNGGFAIVKFPAYTILTKDGGKGGNGSNGVLIGSTDESEEGDSGKSVSVPSPNNIPIFLSLYSTINALPGGTCILTGSRYAGGGSGGCSLIGSGGRREISRRGSAINNEGGTYAGPGGGGAGGVAYSTEPNNATKLPTMLSGRQGGSAIFRLYYQFS